MTKDDILMYLEILNDRLRKKNIRGELFLYGGAVICLALDGRVSTHDLDGIFEPKKTIYDTVQEIADEYGLPSDWLNDSVKGFISNKNDMVEYLDLSNLTISIPTTNYLFAMKCMACRLDEDSNDLDDLKFLIDYIGIKSKEDAEKILLQYFPENLVNPRIGFVLEELFNEN